RVPGRGRVRATENQVQTGQCDGPHRKLAAGPERDMHGPVIAPLGELPGASEGIDDPDSIGSGAMRAVFCLLRQHVIVGPMPCESVCEIGLAFAIAAVLQCLSS